VLVLNAGATPPMGPLDRIRLEGREVLAVFDPPSAPMPGYFMWLEWRDGRIAFIHDYRHARYVADGADLAPAAAAP
jgi:hypothetical protein